MLTLLRRRLARDEGLSILEMMIALFIIAVALMALASSIVTSLTAISRDEKRVRATQLANQLIEDLRGIDWEEVSFYDGEGAPATFSDGSTTYESVFPEPDPTIARPAGSEAPLHSVAGVNRDGVLYDVTTNIYWIDDAGDDVDPVDTDPHDYKGFQVLIEWTDRGNAYEFTSSGTRVPTVDEIEPVAGPPVFEITDFHVSPSTVTIISETGYTAQDMLVTVQTSLPSLQPQLNAGSINTQMDRIDDRNFEFLIEAGNGTFVPGEYDFTVVANEEPANGTGTDTEVVTVTFAEEEDTLTDVVISTPTLSPLTATDPPELCTTNGKLLTTNVVVRFEVTGVGTAEADSSAEIQWTDRSGSATATYISPTAGGDGAIYEAVIPQGHRFDSATTTLYVFAVRTNDAVEADESFTFGVQRGGC